MAKSILLLILMHLMFGSAYAQNASESTQPSAKAVLVIDQKLLREAVKAANENREVEGETAIDLAGAGASGKKGVEINFLGQCDRTSERHECEAVIDANWAVGENVEVSIAQPYEIDAVDGEPKQRGSGAPQVGINYRFFNKNNSSVSLDPRYIIGNTGSHRDADGNPVEGKGDSIFLPITYNRQTGNLVIKSTAGYRRVFKNHADDSVIVGAGVAQALTDRSKLTAEALTERDRNFNKREDDVRVGGIYLVVPKSDLGAQSLFVSLGKSVGKTQDGKTHTFIRFGYKFEQ